MSRVLPILLFAALPLTACAPAATAPATPQPAASAMPSSPAAAPASAEKASAEAPGTVLPTADKASIRGAIRDGNRPPPALRICAHPVAGGAPTCSDSPAGATDYRIDVAPGRYYLMGWVRGGELKLLAHTEQIRCIRAPCPPDELIEVDARAGEETTGIDLSGGYVDIPAGWPQPPA